MKGTRKEVAFRIFSLEVTKEALLALREQLEYYFSARNLLTDSFMQNIINCGKGGWVKAKILINFKKIDKIFQ